MTDLQTRQPRRAWLQQMALGAGLVAAGTRTRPTAALDSDESKYTTTDVTIDSFDGTTIAATLYEPTAEGPHPAVLATHGWGGNRGDVGLGSFASRGYVGLAYDSRGFGESKGKVTLTGENEQKDASELITWLAQRDSVETVAGEPDNPVLGMEGGSYGGGIQFRMAAYDDRVDAIVPEYTWNDLTQALLPNDVLKEGWALGLFLAGQTGNLSTEFEERNGRVLQEGELTDADRAYYESRSTVGYPTDSVNAAVLVVQEFNDRLFPARQGVQNFEWAQQYASEAALILGNGSAHAQFREEVLPGEDVYNQLVGQAVIDWFDDHLKDDEPHGLAPVNYYDAGADAFVEADQFPPASTSAETFTHALSEPIELSGPDAEPVTFDWPVWRETELVGSPSLSVAVRPTGTGTSTGRSHLMAVLQRVSGGEVQTLKEQIMPIAITEETVVEFDLHCVQQVFEPGDTIRLALATSSPPLTDNPVVVEQPLFWPTSGGAEGEDDAGVELRDAEDIELTASTNAADSPPAIAGDPPRDIDDDGLYEDIRGDGSFDIFDVQTLFSNLDSPLVQANSEFFNFQGANSDEVTVFDVQALFAMLE